MFQGSYANDFGGASGTQFGAGGGFVPRQDLSSCCSLQILRLAIEIVLPCVNTYTTVYPSYVLMLN